MIHEGDTNIIGGEANPQIFLELENPLLAASGRSTIRLDHRPGGDSSLASSQSKQSGQNGSLRVRVPSLTGLNTMLSGPSSAFPAVSSSTSTTAVKQAASQRPNR
eukprot:scaffold176378_cov41-Prasinocladus_malaysianus.AAC.1